MTLLQEMAGNMVKSRGPGRLSQGSKRREEKVSQRGARASSCRASEATERGGVTPSWEKLLKGSEQGVTLSCHFFFPHVIGEQTVRKHLGKHS